MPKEKRSACGSRSRLPVARRTIRGDGQKEKNMRYKVVYRCSCGEVREFVEDADNIGDRELQEHRWVIQHAGADPAHVVTLTAAKVDPEKPLDKAKWMKQYEQP